MTKAGSDVSSILPIILLPSRTYIDVELDVRFETTTTPNKGDVSIEGKVSDVTLMNLDNPKWLPENWRFEAKVRTTGAIVGIFDRYCIEPMSRGKFRSMNESLYWVLMCGYADTWVPSCNGNMVLETKTGMECCLLRVHHISGGGTEIARLDSVMLLYFMDKTRGSIVKLSVRKASKNKKRMAEEVSRSSKKKKIVVEEPKSNSDFDTMTKIDNYEDSSAHAKKIVSEDEESSRDTRNTRDEDDDPMSLPICARKISGKSYNLTTWMDELGSFLAKIPVRARMVLYRDFRKLLVQEKIYNDFKGYLFWTLDAYSRIFQVQWTDCPLYVAATCEK
ncbi:hypothetical protein H5410_052121 [Solanum commersonii]|uniref:Uncharacterized protein n=1 Tax=Solanum commersonii TaxID=4109 RepID=A0A9J5X2Q3_SOLCO|nr:hypothetical protein H5410_052121 [Solanum commersonii]